MLFPTFLLLFFFFNDPSTTEISPYRHTLPLPDALPISPSAATITDRGTFGSSGESRWNGTDVTLAWGRRETSLRIESAVLSCRIRCQKPRYFRSGSKIGRAHV